MYQSTKYLTSNDCCGHELCNNQDSSYDTVTQVKPDAAHYRVL